MFEIVTQFALVTLGVALLIAVVRLVKGPTLPDRIVAMDLIGVLVVGLIVVLAASTGVRATLDAAIVIALIGFVGTVAYATYVRAGAPGMTDILTGRHVGGRVGVRAAGGGRRAADARRVHADAGVDEGVDARLGLSAHRRRPAASATSRRSSASLSIGAFVLLTTPVAAHVIARASYLADVPLWDGTVLDERRRDLDRARAARTAARSEHHGGVVNAMTASHDAVPLRAQR